MGNRSACYFRHSKILDPVGCGASIDRGRQQSDTTQTHTHTHLYDWTTPYNQRSPHCQKQQHQILYVFQPVYRMAVTAYFTIFHIYHNQTKWYKSNSEFTILNSLFFYWTTSHIYFTNLYRLVYISSKVLYPIQRYCKVKVKVVKVTVPYLHLPTGLSLKLVYSLTKHSTYMYYTWVTL